MADYLDGLNEQQKEAVLHKDGPLLIVAGAGAGKTKTITHRIAHLINSGVHPRNILAVTFTNKAAKEMRDRVTNLLPGAGVSPTISTFHSLGVMLLKDNAQVLGISKYFTILDKDETLSLIKKSAKEIGVGPKEFSASAVQNIISKEKNKLRTPAEFALRTENNYFCELAHRIWERYEHNLREQKAFDFDDLIQQPVFLLRRNEQIKKYYQDLWKFIHIDEYQDTNTAQYELSKLLAEGHGNICVVGDSDQAIYSWRQADYKNILNFERNFPGTKTVLLEENYRSTKTILEAANQIIRKNRQRKEKNLFTNRTGGEKITVYGAIDETDEARWIVSKIKEMLREKKVPPEEIAVLYRANFQSRVLEERFLRENVAYQLLGTRFYERREVKDIIAIIRYAMNRSDTQSMERIINIPPRGIGDVSFNKIISGKGNELPERLRFKLQEFNEMITKIHEVLLKEKLSDSIKFIIKFSNIAEAFKKEGEEGEERIENLKELVTIASKYDFMSPEEALDKFLTETALLSDQDTLMNRNCGVKLMTVHASKGLEFRYVFITGLEEELFPHKKMDPAEENDPEEERRLFYVAVTRAKDALYLSYANIRTIFGQRKMNMPSHFLQDITDDLADFELPYDNSFTNIRHNDDQEDVIVWDCLK